MPTISPKVPRDFLLAPVAAEIELDLELDRPEINHTREERTARVLEVALRNVDLHHWQAKISDDAARLQLTGGSVTLDLGLSAGLLHYIEGTPS